MVGMGVGMSGRVGRLAKSIDHAHGGMESGLLVFLGRGA